MLSCALVLWAVHSNLRAYLPPTFATYSTGEFYQYAYDAVGNRLSLTTHESVVNYAYDAANRLLVSSSPGHSVSYTWDNNGSLLSDGLRSYGYDHANRLTQVVSGTLTTQFTYDGYLPNHIKRANELLSIGNRVRTVVDGQATDYVMDVASPLPQALVATTEGQSSYYLHGADLISQYDSGTWAYHLPDALGSVRSLTDPTGQVVGGYGFDPFGVPMQESGGDPYGFTGEWWESQTELLYLRARHYQPHLGRFISADTIVPDPSYPQALNRFSYVANNPVKYRDPTGHMHCITLSEFDPERPPWREPAKTICFGYNDRGQLIIVGGTVYTGWDLAIANWFLTGEPRYIEPVWAYMEGDPFRAKAMAALAQTVCDELRPFPLAVDCQGWGPLGDPIQYINAAAVGQVSLLTLGIVKDGCVAAFGSLPPEYGAQIQKVIDKTGLPIYVVGGYARGDPHPRKDIDYYIDVEYRKQWTEELRKQLPGQELRRGICTRACDTELFWEMGWGDTPPGVHPPYIKFTPGEPPVWVKE